MRRKYLLDTGPLVAFLSRRDRHHAWARTLLATVAPPLLTCEAVVSEACFLLRGVPGGARAVFDLLHRELVLVAFDLGSESLCVGKLLERYESVPMSVADACLVRMSELSPDSKVITADSDFRIYRRNGRQRIDTMMPDDEAA